MYAFILFVDNHHLQSGCGWSMEASHKKDRPHIEVGKDAEEEDFIFIADTYEILLVISIFTKHRL